MWKILDASLAISALPWGISRTGSSFLIGLGTKLRQKFVKNEKNCTRSWLRIRNSSYLEDIRWMKIFGQSRLFIAARLQSWRYEDEKNGFQVVATRKGGNPTKKTRPWQRKKTVRSRFSSLIDVQRHHWMSAITRVKTIKLCRRDRTKCP